MEKRSIGVAILLSLVTCGIYSMYWMYALSKDLIEYNGEVGESAGTELLLSIITCGLYFIYWCYKMGQRIYDAEVKSNVAHPNDDSVMYLILGIFGFGIIAMAIMQSKTNAL
ncbi:uncharacterized protein DUF4234 [Natranaerovirga hydrolytica]|uniref:Uncharacterized protein DUF4234 n=1 Tax=Natranaerovirga hydrolytica TaxID=680378 RepID=A0A4R1MEK0_9FIRM|nr:DUF4234 domain-containing protein [Natranaerovirga hydrolytica]TCK90557.1 uncharacterized protein DUF4234 [Natranaerovirga hydrolytica]